MLVIGMGAWGVRYLLFSLGAAGGVTSAIVAGILLHGVCYDFFFVTGQIYVDKTAPKTIQASAQGFIGVVTYGIGMVIGGLVSGQIVRHFELQQEAGKLADRWPSIWLAPAAMAAVVIVLFALLFRDKPQGAAEQPATAEPAAEQ